ncbi:MAG: EAL domain-containing protein [Gammaproteobacteria bacterium]|nr:EAL domain-containing protein [Gammaproteobacteria bacterium]
MPHDGLTLSSEVVDALFPFHILTNQDGTEVLSVGNGLLELLGENFLTRDFDQLFQITRPRLEDLSINSVKSHLRSSVLLKIRDSDVTLRGQVLISSATTVLFIGSVLVKSGDALERKKLSLQVFPPFDLTPDLIILHKFRELENKDRLKNSRQLFEMSKSRDKLSHYAYTDELTNLANRRGFWQSGKQILQEHGNDDSARIILTLLDLDQFKSINDQHGHDAGDAVICETADRLKRVVGNRGLVARLGGDEFVALIILDSYQNPQERVLQVFNAVNGPFRRGHLQLSIVSSMGATNVQSSDTLENAIDHADKAMYEGRQNERGAVFWYTEELSTRILEKKHLLERLEAAIRSELIIPHFQPVLDLSNFHLASFEALARWNDDQLGAVRPDIFITLAEELGMLDQLDMLILGKSLDQLARWHAQGKYYDVHVNVSAASIDLSLVDHVMSALEIRNIEPRFLILELTETTILENTRLTREVIELLKEKGVRVQLDDFGTGYSSLSHIRDFPVAGIKIDRSFVVDAHINDKSRTLLKSVVNIALDLNLDIVAEGIENQQQMEFLANFGCTYAQGFYIGEPASADTCEYLFSQLSQQAA